MLLVNEIIFSLKNEILRERPKYEIFSKKEPRELLEYEILPNEYKLLLEIIWGMPEWSPELYFDFIPWYRLLTLQDSKRIFESIFWKEHKSEWFFPIMENYSSDYYAINTKKEVWLLLHDAESIFMYDSIESMLITIDETYKKNWYLIQNGLLNVIEVIEEKIWLKLNKKATYWKFFAK